MHVLPSYTLTHDLPFFSSHISIFNFFLMLVPNPKPWNLQLFLFFENNTYIDPGEVYNTFCLIEF